METGGAGLLVFVDANILIYHLESTPNLGARASARLAAIRAAGGQVVISDLIRLECRVGPLKLGDGSLLSLYDRFFAIPSVRVAALTPAVCDPAASPGDPLSPH